MICIQCNSMTIQIKDTISCVDDGKVLTVVNIPGSYCEKCRETFFEAKVDDRLTELVKATMPIHENRIIKFEGKEEA